MPSKAELKIIELLQALSGGGGTGGGGTTTGLATETKQDAQITQETSLNTVLGQKTDTTASTDTGVFSLTSLFKRSLQKLTSILVSNTVTASALPQVISVGDSSGVSATFNGSTTKIILNSTTDCWISINSSPVASIAAGSFFLSAGVPSYPISVNGGTDKLAVIQNQTSGYLSIFESL
jgi:hypothetical protein